MSKKFFESRRSTKNTYAHPEMGGARGYTPFGKETAVGETTPDLKEFWHHGPIMDDSYDQGYFKYIVAELQNLISNLMYYSII